MNPVRRLLLSSAAGLQRLAGMVTDKAKPGLTGVRNTQSGHPASGITPERLAAILRAAEEGDTNAYLELAEDMEERDLHYLAVLGTRRRSVSQLDISVKAASTDDPAHKAHADMIGKWLDRDVLQAELFDMLDAIGKGFSVTQVLWDTTGGVWLPRELKWTDPRWFELDQVDMRTLRLRNDTGGADDLAPHKWIIHTHQAKSGLPIKGGLARPVAWAWMFRTSPSRIGWCSWRSMASPCASGAMGPKHLKKTRKSCLTR